MSDGVVFLPSFHEAIKDLPDAERLGAYDAVVRYGLYGEVMEMSPVVKSMFALMKPVIDSSQRRHRAAKENGKMPAKDPDRPRGRPPKNQTKNQSGNQTQNQDIDKDIDFDMDSDMDSDFDKDFDSEPERDRESLRGDGRTEAERLQTLWRAAASSKERFDLSNKLYCIGWNIDPVTGELARRS